MKVASRIVSALLSIGMIVSSLPLNALSRGSDGFVFLGLQGDVNGDGKVDLKDVYAVGKAYGAYPGHPRWVASCDINGDGKIDLKDYYIVCKNYGKYSAKIDVTDVRATSSIVGTNCTFTAFWNGSNLSGQVFGWNASDSWQNSSWTDPWEGTPKTGWSVIAKRLPLKPNALLLWQIWCNDTSNRWTSTGLQDLKLVSLDYSTTEPLEVLNCSSLILEPSNFQPVFAGDFLDHNQWVERAFAGRFGKYLRMSSINTEGPHICAYEIQVRANSTWISPEIVYNYCGGLEPQKLVDNDTESFWQHNYHEPHNITVKFNTVRFMTGVRWFCADTPDSNITSCNVSIDSSWYANGTSPWINAVDYPSNYVYTSQPATVLGDFIFNRSKAVTIESAHLALNMSVWGSAPEVLGIEYFHQNESYGTYEWKNNTERLSGTNGMWRLQTVALDKYLWRPDKVNDAFLKFRFRCLVETQNIRIDHAYLLLKTSNQSTALKWLFDTMALRYLTSSFPLVRQFDEATYSTQIADSEILSSILLHKLAGNSTYLNYSKTYADWLNTTQVCRLFQRYNLTSESWIDEELSILRSGRSLLSLAILATMETQYKPLLQKATNNFTSIFVKQNTKLAVPSFVNGSVSRGRIAMSTHEQSIAIAAIVYSGNVLENRTLSNLACEMCLNYTFGAKGVPYFRLYWQDGKAYDRTCKEDEAYGYMLLATELTYMFTGNATVKERIRSMAEASQYFFNSTANAFAYRIDADTGQQLFSFAVHGFGLADEALVQAYLIWNNSTWLDYAISDFTSNAVEGDLTKNDLIGHNNNWGSSYPQVASDANEYWNVAAKRVALIFYCLNYSFTYRNNTFLQAYDKLYSATSAYHKCSLGWREITNLNTLGFYYAEGREDASLNVIFRGFMNVTDKTVNSLTDLYDVFGNFVTGET